MELEELLQLEGVEADDLAEVVAWANRRAEELVAGLVADGELGPLLDADFTGEVLPRRPSLDEEAGREVPPHPAPEPMAAAAYDPGSVVRRLPGPDDPRHGEDTTQPRALPSDGAAITTSGAIEIDAAEIEMLDEDDLELVEDAEGEGAAPARAPTDEVPEWQAALTSATLGGDSKADQDSGLHRLPGEDAGDVLTDPSKGAPPLTPRKLEPRPVDHDESMDIDLGDL